MGTDAAQRFEDLFFSTEKFRTGSVTEYYNEISGGKISLNGEVISPLRMPCALPAYANGNSGMTDDTPNAQNMTVDALDALRGQVNLNQYDNDRNGYVDAFIMVHAGQGAEQTVSKDDIWSLKWTIPNAILLNDTSIFAFFTTPEDATIGVAAHELCHLVFGWPDLCDVDYSSEGVGNWYLMAGGVWSGLPPGFKPCHHSAWCKLT
jgi:immune inhibitor A